MKAAAIGYVQHTGHRLERTQQGVARRNTMLGCLLVIPVFTHPSGTVFTLKTTLLILGHVFLTDAASILVAFVFGAPKNKWVRGVTFLDATRQNPTHIHPNYISVMFICLCRAPVLFMPRQVFFF